MILPGSATLQRRVGHCRALGFDLVVTVLYVLRLMLLRRISFWHTGHAASRLIAVGAVLLVVCAASVQVMAQDANALLDALGGGDEAPVTVIDLLADKAVLGELQLNNSQRQRVAEIVTNSRQQQAQLREQHAAELATLGDTAERIRRRAAHRRHTREQTAQWREQTATALADVLDDRQVKMLEEKLEMAGEDIAVRTESAGDAAARTYAAPARQTEDTIASFGTKTDDAAPSDTPPADGDVASTSAATEAIQIAFNFHEAPWTDVLRLFTDAAGLTLHLRETPPGFFTYYDRRSYTPTEALDVMNRYLLQDGFILVRHDRFLTVLDVNKGIPPNLIETVPVESLITRGATELLRVALPLGDRDAATAAEEVRGLLGPQGTVVSLESAGSIVVTDIAANLRRVQQLLEPPPIVADAQMTFRSFPLVHVDAQSAADTVRSLFGVVAGMTNVSAGGAGGSGSSSSSSRESSRGSRGFDPREMMRRFAEAQSGGGGDRGGGRSSGASAGGQQSPSSTNVSVDRRTNSVLVRAKAEDMKLVSQVIEAIDIPPGEATAFDRGDMLSEPFLQVYQLESADPQEVAKTLSVLHPGMVINEDGRARRVHVWATPAEHREIALHIRQLDGGAAGESLVVIPLDGMNAFDVSATLTSLYASDPDGAPSIQYDPSGRGLIVRGSASQVMQIRALVGQLALQGGPVASQRTIRIVPVGSPNGQFVQQAISALYPQVTVINTPDVASNATSGSSDNGRDRRSSGERSSEDQERAERIRRFMEMRDRWVGGGDSSRDRGSRSERGGGDDRRSGRGR
jgi:type II secretory pathway component GspD/PulD (secretin)